MPGLDVVAQSNKAIVIFPNLFISIQVFDKIMFKLDISVSTFSALYPGTRVYVYKYMYIIH